MNSKPTQTPLPTARSCVCCTHISLRRLQVHSPGVHTHIQSHFRDTAGSLPAHFAPVMLSELPGVHKTGTVVTGIQSCCFAAMLCSSPLPTISVGCLASFELHPSHRIQACSSPLPQTHVCIAHTHLALARPMLHKNRALSIIALKEFSLKETPGQLQSDFLLKAGSAKRSNEVA